MLNYRNIGRSNKAGECACGSLDFFETAQIGAASGIIVCTQHETCDSSRSRLPCVTTFSIPVVIVSHPKCSSLPGPQQSPWTAAHAIQCKARFLLQPTNVYRPSRHVATQSMHCCEFEVPCICRMLFLSFSRVKKRARAVVHFDASVTRWPKIAIRCCSRRPFTP